MCWCTWLNFLSSLPFWQQYNLSISKTSKASLTLPLDSQPYLLPSSSLGTVPSPRLAAALACPFLRTASGDILASSLSPSPRAAALPSRFFPLLQWPIFFHFPSTDVAMFPPYPSNLNHLRPLLGFWTLFSIASNRSFAFKILYDPVLVFH